jgi:hypothetical protein
MSPTLDNLSRWCDDVDQLLADGDTFAGSTYCECCGAQSPRQCDCLGPLPATSYVPDIAPEPAPSAPATIVAPGRYSSGQVIL